MRQGAIFLPSHSQAVLKIVQASGAGPGRKIVDLGSGDGRLVIALAKTGAQVDGFEINPILIWWSRLRIKKTGLVDRARIYQRNFWSVNLSEYDTVVLFGTTHIMQRLENKLKSELHKGSLVVSNVFQFPGLEEMKNDKGIYVYRI